MRFNRRYIYIYIGFDQEWGLGKRFSCIYIYINQLYMCVYIYPYTTESVVYVCVYIYIYIYPYTTEPFAEGPLLIPFFGLCNIYLYIYTYIFLLTRIISIALKEPYKGRLSGVRAKYI